MEVVDQNARNLITRSGLDRTLFVEAGAGTGKTSALVSRIVELVVTDRARISEVAAITFTEAAASELRDRVRDQFESERHGADERGDVESATRCRDAIEELDASAISTLHAFAQRILSEHPVLVGIPPRVEVLDEVQSQLEAEKRWSRFLDDIYAQEDAAELLQRAESLGIKFNDRFGGGPRAVARNFDDNWDRIDALAATKLATLDPLDWDVVVAIRSRFLRLLNECDDESDKLAESIRTEWVEPLDRALDAPTDIQRLELLAELKVFKAKKVSGLSGGRKDNWGNVVDARNDAKDTASQLQDFREKITNETLVHIATHIAAFTRDNARHRTAEGRLEFHDLLVLARKLLREHPDARAELRSRYSLLLLDEFQDTDPIQIEIAVLIASSYEGVATEPWDTYDVEDGCLFFVGDPKQSIYRFRRADIGLFLDARERFAPDEPVALTQNFRTVAPIIDWVNAVFGDVLESDTATEHDVGYVPLTAAREGHPRVDHRPVVLGSPHPDEKVRAGELRRLEAEAVALAIAQINDEPLRWLVADTAESTTQETIWRKPKLRDITILLPTRTSLPFLQRALNDCGVPFRADTGTLLFDQPEIRAMRAALMAVADPGDELAVVAALRSSLLACGDDQLLTWRNAGGRWDYSAPRPSSISPDDHVARCMAQLAAWHADRWWLEPSALIQRIARDRQAFAKAYFDRRPRDSWRRLRYLTEQARAFQESGGGDLRAFLDWVDLQGKDGARAHEPTLDEEDDDAVRIMTIHGSKGLEFPITIVSGLTTQHQAVRRGIQVLWPPGQDTPEISLSKGVTTDGFDAHAELEGQMDRSEKDRLLYVACTRARDHLLVSGVHNTKPLSHARTLWELSDDTEIARPFEPPVVAPGMGADQLGLPLLDDTRAAREEFVADRDRLLATQALPSTVSATWIARTGDADIGDGERDESSDQDDGSDTAPAWRRGRAGTAIGRAVHGVLQSVDFADPSDVDSLARSLAHAHAVPWAIDQIAASVRHALSADIVAQALASGRYWKELFVAVPAGELTIEGYVDLLVETPAGLVVVDYKTDAVGSDADVDAKVERYRLQAAAYAYSLAETTGRPVAGATFLFAQPDQLIERRVVDLPAAIEDVRRLATR